MTSQAELEVLEALEAYLVQFRMLVNKALAESGPTIRPHIGAIGKHLLAGAFSSNKLIREQAKRMAEDIVKLPSPRST